MRRLLSYSTRARCRHLTPPQVLDQPEKRRRSQGGQHQCRCRAHWRRRTVEGAVHGSTCCSPKTATNSAFYSRRCWSAQTPHFGGVRVSGSISAVHGSRLRDKVPARGHVTSPTPHALPPDSDDAMTCGSTRHAWVQARATTINDTREGGGGTVTGFRMSLVAWSTVKVIRLWIAHRPGFGVRPT
jgi:hypothetical protein